MGKMPEAQNFLIPPRTICKHLSTAFMSYILWSDFVRFCLKAASLIANVLFYDSHEDKLLIAFYFRSKFSPFSFPDRLPRPRDHD